MIYLTCQPATKRFAWEVEVQLENFKLMGIAPQNTHVVLGLEHYQIPIEWYKLKEKYPLVKFFFYKDTRIDNSYSPSIQSHILEKHWIHNPYLASEAILFIDSDVLFTRMPDWTDYLKDDNWYFSDTISYIGANYIKSKGEELLDMMCGIVGISKQLVIFNQENSGGAQKLIKNVTSDYWANVYNKSNKMFKIMTPVVNKLFNERKQKGINDGYPLQIWTSTMWVEFWEGLLLNRNVRVIKYMDFMFAVNPISDWDKMLFYHNAGVGDSKGGLFFKGSWVNELPYNYEIEKPNTNLAGYKYYEFMKAVGKNTCLT